MQPTPIEPVANYTIRPATHADRERVIALVSAMFRDDVSARYDWLYRSNPHGNALSWLAIEGGSGDAVGVTSLFPRRVVVGGQARTGSIGGDCYIAPRARRRGLATMLHNATFAEMRGLGVDFMYGPPRPHNLGALLKAGSVEVTTFRRYIRPLTLGTAVETLAHVIPARMRHRAEQVAARLGNASIRMFDKLSRAHLGGHRLERVTTFDARFSDLSAQVATLYRFACVRDAEYLDFRYARCPNHTQVPHAVFDGTELVGLLVIEHRATVAVITDVFVAPHPARIDAVLQLAVDQAVASGSARIEISVTPGSPVAARLARHGFVDRGGPVFQVAVATHDPATRVLQASDGLHFTDGDKDCDTVFSVEPE